MPARPAGPGSGFVVTMTAMTLVVCGEALIDLIPAPGAPASTQFSTWQAFSAGGPMNTAIALARLGDDVQFLGRLGVDGFADQLRRHLAANRVGLDFAVTAQNEGTSLAIVSLDETGHASYTFHLRGTANFGWTREEFPHLGAQDWLHTGSLPAVVEPGRTALLSYVEQTEAGVSFDLNVRPTIVTDPAAYRELLDPFLTLLGRRGGVVRASDEDLGFLAGDSSADPRDLAADLVGRYGCELLVVTLGGEGALACGRDQAVTTVEGFPVEVVDTVGAGDTFTAGFLDARLAGRDLATAMRRGCAAASIVCSRAGANPPTRAEVDAVLGS